MFNGVTLFYKRIEEEDKVSIVYNTITTKLPMLLILAGLLFLKISETVHFFSFFSALCIIAMAITGLLYIIQVPKIKKETDRAYRENRIINITGSDYSIKHPLTIEFRKPQQ